LAEKGSHPSLGASLGLPLFNPVAALHPWNEVTVPFSFPPAL